jgi:glycosyltransferase involved in cell wall biosynthesis
VYFWSAVPEFSRVEVAIPNGQRKPPRILHVVESLDRGAVENWLLRMFGHARKREIELDWTFYCILEQPGAMDEKALALGARVIHSPVPIVKKAEFIRALRRELRRGEYDVLHCHHDILSAVYLLAASRMQLRRRIVHVHNADQAVPTSSRLKHLYREPMRQVCLFMADRIIGISNHTLNSFLAGRARRPERDSVHYYGVDPTPFENVSAGHLGFRRRCDLPDDASILLFGGRLVPEKNPVFAVEVLASLRRMDSHAVAVFVGSGSQEEDVLKRARELGVESSVRLLGWRNDLAEIMSCSDWFILPHPEHPVEGFGLAIVEAQLAGLRLLLSRGILDDPLLPTASFRRLPLSDGPNVWAKAAMELLQDPAPLRAAAVAALKESPMDMDRALEGLLKLHA